LYHNGSAGQAKKSGAKERKVKTRSPRTEGCGTPRASAPPAGRAGELSVSVQDDCFRVPRNPSRIGGRRGDHFPQADFSLLIPSQDRLLPDCRQSTQNPVFHFPNPVCGPLRSDFWNVDKNEDRSSGDWGTCNGQLDFQGQLNRFMTRDWYVAAIRVHTCRSQNRRALHPSGVHGDCSLGLEVRRLIQASTAPISTAQ